MTKTSNKLLSLLLVLLFAVTQIAGVAIWMPTKVKAATEEYLYKSLTFPDDNEANNAVSTYIDTWTAKIGTDEWSISNFNNNKWGGGWTYIKCGRKNYDSTGSITSGQYAEPVSKVVITVGKATTGKISDTKLTVATDSAFTENVQTVSVKITSTAEATYTYTVPTPKKNCYYKLEFVCTSASSNGVIQINKVEYFAVEEKEESDCEHELGEAITVTSTICSAISDSYAVCSKCEKAVDSDGNVISDLDAWKNNILNAGHDYDHGVCKNCSAKDPSYVPLKEYELVTSVSDLHAGNKIIIVYEAGAKAAGVFDSKSSYLLAVDATIKNGVATSKEAVEITLGGGEGAWTLVTSEGTIGALSDPALSKTSGITTWTIAIDANGTAAITSTGSNYGAIKYNTSAPRFRTYKSGQGDIQIYKLVCTHTNAAVDPDTAVAATCTEAGKEADTVCPDCGDVVATGATIDALGHTSTNPVAAVPAACNGGSGTKAYSYCSACENYIDENDVIIGDAAALAKWLDVGGAGYIAKPDHVDEDKDGKCDNCETEMHVYGEWEVYVASTCSVKGEDRRYCKDCEAYETREHELDPNNHDGIQHKDKVPATCTVAGTEEYYYCNACNNGKYYSDNQCKVEMGSIAIPALGHDFDENGECKNGCDVSLLDLIYALGSGQSLSGTYTLKGVITEIVDVYNEQYKNISVNIVVNGDTDHPIECFRLKGTGADKLAVGYTIVVTGTIKNFSGTYEFNADCTFVCSHEEGAAQLELVRAAEPTCTEKGYTGDVECKICGDIIEEGEEIAENGHNFVNGECTVCHAKLHNMELADAGKAATCTEAGQKAYYVCKDDECGAYAEDANAYNMIEDLDAWLVDPNGGYIAPLGHAWEDNANGVVCCTRENCNAIAHKISGWKLTDLADISADDIVVITMMKDEKTWALTSGNGASKAPAATVVTVADGSFSADPADELLWNIVKNDDGTFKIYVNGTTEMWLYTTSANDGIRVGTGDACVWQLSKEDYLTVAEGKNTRYMGVYNEKDWRSYTSLHANIAGETLGFYVYNNICHELTGEPVVANGLKTYTCTVCGESIEEFDEKTAVVADGYSARLEGYQGLRASFKVNATDETLAKYDVELKLIVSANGKTLEKIAFANRKWADGFEYDSKNGEFSAVIKYPDEVAGYLDKKVDVKVIMTVGEKAPITIHANFLSEENGKEDAPAPVTLKQIYELIVDDPYYIGTSFQKYIDEIKEILGIEG